MTLAFCPSCGTKRLGSARHCASCGADYWKLASGSVSGLSPSASAPPGSPVLVQEPASASSSEPNPNVPLIAGLAWIGSAAAIGYLAFLQLQFVGTDLPGAEGIGGVALLNGISAAVTLYFGARLILGPTRRVFGNSALWAGLTVAYGAYQVSQGVTSEIYILALVLAAVAGVLSFVAVTNMPR